MGAVAFCGLIACFFLGLKVFYWERVTSGRVGNGTVTRKWLGPEPMIEVRCRLDGQDRTITRRVERRIWDRLDSGYKIEVFWHPRTPDHAFLPLENQRVIDNIFLIAASFFLCYAALVIWLTARQLRLIRPLRRLCETGVRVPFALVGVPSFWSGRATIRYEIEGVQRTARPLFPSTRGTWGPPPADDGVLLVDPLAPEKVVAVRACWLVGGV